MIWIDDNENDVWHTYLLKSDDIPNTRLPVIGKFGHHILRENNQIVFNKSYQIKICDFFAVNQATNANNRQFR